MSWLSSFWDHNRNFIGNAIKNVSPALAFTPLGPPGAGLAGALGDSFEKGHNLGDILKSGASNAAIGAGTHGLYGAARGALGAGSSGFAAGATGAAPPPPVNIGGVSVAAPQAAPSVAALAGAPAPSASSQLLAGLKGVGSFAKNNATVLGQVGSGVLNANQMSHQNALAERQQSFQEQQYNDQVARQKRISDLLGPIYAQMAQMANSPPPVAPNPYRSR